MGLLGNILAGLVHLACAGLDLVILLLIVRLLRPSVNLRFVAQVDDAARPVVDSVVAYLRRRLVVRGRSRLSSTAVAVSLVVLLAARMVLCLLASAAMGR